MIVINLKGGLGNQLFQYAAAFAIAELRKQQLFFSVDSFEGDEYDRKYSLTPFRIDNDCYSNEKVQDFLNLPLYKRLFNYFKPRESKYFYSQKDFEIDLSILTSNPENQYLSGYFANQRYFLHIRETLQQKITLKSKYRTDLFRSTVKWIRDNKFISVHVRRADYISNKSASNLFESLNREYYNRCFQYFQKNIDGPPKFLFFSDDLPWVKEEFIGLDNCYFVEQNSLYKDYYDLMFMAECEHNIIANSTFSWWGAWLNKNPSKVVLAPKKWYRKSEHQTFSEKTEFIPTNWIVL